DNGSKTISLGGNLSTAGSLSTVGAFSSIFNMTANTNVTFPATGTLATTSSLPTGAALTATGDTNMSITLGGSPASSLLNAASIALAWTGVLSADRGGSGIS